MNNQCSENRADRRCRQLIVGIIMSTFMLLSHFNVFSQSVDNDSLKVVDTPVINPMADRHVFVPDEPIERPDTIVTSTDTVEAIAIDLDSITPAVDPYGWQQREVAFTPSPTKAVWLSALFPGLGQIYNRRYWKLPIIAGGYLGLIYATSWNNTMLSDYTTAFADLLDNDPNTKSYMDFFPPNIKEESLDKTWLQNILKSRKNYFRRNRDLCIIAMVGVYLLSMVDAYVDASLSHFDISPDLSMDVVPTLIQDGRSTLPSVGLQWALNF